MSSNGEVIGLFVPCYVDELWPEAAKSAVRLIEALGKCVEIAEPVCCGQVLSNAGDERGASAVRKVWRDGHSRFSDVIVLSASCCGFLQKHERGGPRIIEFCEWMARFGPEEFPGRLERKLAMHSSCASRRETRTAAHAREVLSRVPGLEIYEPERHEECCGFGGTFSVNFPELSVRMGKDQMRQLQTSGAGVTGVVSADCSCLLHLGGIAAKELSFQHVAEVLWEATQ